MLPTSGRIAALVDVSNPFSKLFSNKSDKPLLPSAWPPMR
jgi:hypothetical protein